MWKFWTSVRPCIKRGLCSRQLLSQHVSVPWRGQQVGHYRISVDRADPRRQCVDFQSARHLNRGWRCNYRSASTTNEGDLMLPQERVATAATCMIRAQAVPLGNGPGSRQDQGSQRGQGQGWQRRPVGWRGASGCGPYRELPSMQEGVRHAPQHHKCR